MQSTMIWMYYMIKSYIETYETYGTLETAINLCQYLLDTDQVLPQYKTLCNYLLLEGCCYDVGYIICLLYTSDAADE